MQKRRALWVVVPVLLIVTLFALFACCCPGQRVAPLTAPPPPPRAGFDVPVPVDVVPAKETDVQMQNVNFRVDTSTVLHIHELRGQMFDKQSGRPLNLDDKNSFTVRLFTAHIGTNAATLSSMLNAHVFRGSNVRDVTVSMHDGHLYPEGIIHKIIDIPFRMTADVSATRDGTMRIHPTRIEICNLNGAALMKAFGITFAKVIGKLPSGVHVEGNDLVVDSLAIIPSPHIEGRLSAAQIEGDELTQDFDDGRGVAPLRPPDAAKNFMYFEHGTLRMGKLFMVSADMEVIDTDASDPFDFYLDRYNEQLVAGYNRNRANYGLTVYMRDLEDVGKPARPGEHLAP